jgi:hypothetical protein
LRVRRAFLLAFRFDFFVALFEADFLLAPALRTGPEFMPTNFLICSMILSAFFAMALPRKW